MAKGNSSKKTEKKRLDVLLTERELVSSRSYAKAVIMTGVVYVDGQKIDKPGTLIDINSQIIVRQAKSRYVSRGGFKLEAALEHFNVDTTGLVCLDVGASTGGFTDCLLQHGARKVFALDVGYGQLDWNLRKDPRVIVRERINCRYLKPQDIGEKVDLVVIDVSFISLAKIVPAVIKILNDGGKIIALIKPQFEVGKGEVGKGGIVRDESKYTTVIQKITTRFEELDCEVYGVIESPVTGADGNREFLIMGVKTG